MGRQGHHAPLRQLSFNQMEPSLLAILGAPHKQRSAWEILSNSKICCCEIYQVFKKNLQQQIQKQGRGVGSMTVWTFSGNSSIWESIGFPLNQYMSSEIFTCFIYVLFNLSPTADDLYSHQATAPPHLCIGHSAQAAGSRPCKSAKSGTSQFSHQITATVKNGRCLTSPSTTSSSIQQHIFNVRR